MSVGIRLNQGLNDLPVEGLGVVLWKDKVVAQLQLFLLS